MLGIGVCLVAMRSIWNPWDSRDSSTRTTALTEAATSSSPDTAVNDSGATLRLASRKGDDAGGVLGASMPMPGSPGLLPPGSQASLSSDVFEWMSAYGDLDPTPWLAMTTKTAVTLSPMLSDPKALDEWWRSSLEAVRHIRFDPTKTTSRLIPLNTLRDRLKKKCQCATRDVGRPFMRAALDAGQLGVEVVFAGFYDTTATSPLTAAEMWVTFAWNPQASKWTVVRICLIDIPMGLDDDPPLL